MGREFIPRDGKSPGQTKTAMAQLEVVSSKDSLRWRLEKFRPWQVEATVEKVKGQNLFSAEPAKLERKDIQSPKPVLIWQISRGLTCGQALYAFHQGDVSS